MFNISLNQKVKSSISTTEKFIDASEQAATKSSSVEAKYQAKANELAPPVFARTNLPPAKQQKAIKFFAEVWFRMNHPQADATKFKSEVAALTTKKHTLQSMLALPKVDRRAAFSQAKLSRSDIRREHGASYAMAREVEQELSRD